MNSSISVFHQFVDIQLFLVLFENLLVYRYSDLTCVINSK